MFSARQVTCYANDPDLRMVQCLTGSERCWNVGNCHRASSLFDPGIMETTRVHDTPNLVLHSDMSTSTAPRSVPRFTIDRKHLQCFSPQNAVFSTASLLLSSQEEIARVVSTLKLMLCFAVVCCISLGLSLSYSEGNVPACDLSH